MERYRLLGPGTTTAGTQQKVMGAVAAASADGSNSRACRASTYVEVSSYVECLTLLGGMASIDRPHNNGEQLASAVACVSACGTVEAANACGHLPCGV